MKTRPTLLLSLCLLVLPAVAQEEIRVGVELQPYQPYSDVQGGEYRGYARDLLDAFRQQVREWEAGAEGLLLSFIGKLPGLAVRLSLVLGMMAWASDEAEEPREITAWHFGRAAHLVEAYLLPMARRAYADAAGGKGERAGRRLVALLRETGLRQFTAREVLRLERAGLATAGELNPGLAALEEAGCQVRAYDPAVPNVYPFKVDSLEEAVDGAHGIVVLARQHELDEVNLDLFKRLMAREGQPFIVDTKNLYDPEQVWQHGFKLERL